MHGPQRLSLKSGEFYAICFQYNRPFGECRETHKIAKPRLRNLKDQFRRDQKVARWAPSLAGILQDSAIEPSIHLYLDLDGDERWEEFFRLYHIPFADNV